MQESAIKTAGTRRHDPDFRNQAVSHTGLLHALSPIRVGLIGLDIKFITGSRPDHASITASLIGELAPGVTCRYHVAPLLASSSMSSV